MRNLNGAVTRKAIDPVKPRSTIIYITKQPGVLAGTELIGLRRGRVGFAKVISALFKFLEGILFMRILMLPIQLLEN